MSLLERYKNGEYEQVWTDLSALGADVRKPQYLSDALAVARETSLRARSNVEALIRKLETLGYEFHTSARARKQTSQQTAQVMDLMNALSSQFRNNTNPAVQQLLKRNQAMMQNPLLQGLLAKAAQPSAPVVPPLQDHSVFSPPDKNVGGQIETYESFLGGPLPLSYRAWCENVGSVSLQGVHPLLSFREGEGRQAMYVAPEMLRFGPQGIQDQVKSAGWDIVSGKKELLDRSRKQTPLTDPLVVSSFAEIWDEDPSEDEEESGPSRLPVAPDDLHKANISGDCYYIEVPDEGADCPFLDWHETTFVNYLRIAFRWGGFPGWERYEDRPQKELSYLAEGLLPI
jgi:hypothetical protein